MCKVERICLRFRVAFTSSALKVFGLLFQGDAGRRDGTRPRSAVRACACLSITREPPLRDISPFVIDFIPYSFIRQIAPQITFSIDFICLHSS